MPRCRRVSPLIPFPIFPTSPLPPPTPFPISIWADLAGEPSSLEVSHRLLYPAQLSREVELTYSLSSPLEIVYNAPFFSRLHSFRSALIETERAALVALVAEVRSHGASPPSLPFKADHLPVPPIDSCPAPLPPIHRCNARRGSSESEPPRHSSRCLPSVPPPTSASNASERRDSSCPKIPTTCRSNLAVVPSDVALMSL